MNGAVNRDIVLLRAHQTRVLNAGKLGNLLGRLVQVRNPDMESIYRTLQNRQESCCYAEPRPKPRKRPTHRTKWDTLCAFQCAVYGLLSPSMQKCLEELEAIALGRTERRKLVVTNYYCSNSSGCWVDICFLQPW